MPTQDKAKLSIYGARYRAKNKQQLNEANKKYRETHVEEIRAYQKEYQKEYQRKLYIFKKAAAELAGMYEAVDYIPLWVRFEEPGLRLMRNVGRGQA